MLVRASRILLFLLLILSAPPARPYSVQTHQQIIDLVWLDSIQPLLLARYPGLTPAQLQQAHAYAYGGSAIQDLGYYPFGKEYFSDLTHYVRPGDFVLALIENAHTANELAFAIGALSHYLGDIYGHSIAVNPSVAIEFPKLARKYGPSVSYEDDEHAHVRTEFAFDINEISKHRFAPLHYLRHVGLGVPTPLLYRAFFETYGLDAQAVLGKRRPLLHTFEFGVRSFLPRIAYAETVLHRHYMPPDSSSPEVARLVADLRKSELENNWAPWRRKAGIGTYSLAALIFILPKVGFLSDLAIRGPVPFTEDLYVVSLNRTISRLRDLLADFDEISARLPDRDLDTGQPIRPGAYRLADQTYASLVNDLAANPTQPIPPRLKHAVLAYFDHPALPSTITHHPKQWQRLQASLSIVASIPTTTIPPPTPPDAESITPP